MALREILAEFGVKVDHDALEKFDHQIEGVKGKLEQLAGIVGGLFIGKEISEFIQHQVEAGDALVDLADKLGVGADELQAFQYSAGIFGVGADQAALSLSLLNKNVGEAVTGNKEAAKSFSDLKIHLKDNNGQVREANDLIPEIADAFAEMKSQQERAAVAMKLFGRSGQALLPFLSKGSEGVKELNDEFIDLGGGMSKSFLEMADKAGDQAFRLNFAIMGLKTTIVEQILPGIMSFTTWLTQLVVGLRKFVDQTTFVKTALASLSLAGIIAAFALLDIEVILVVAAFLAAYLALDDLYALFTGGDSVIGDFIDSIGGVGASQAFVKEVTDAVHELMQAFHEMRPELEVLAAAFTWVFKNVLGFLLAGVVQTIQWIASAISGIAKALTFLNSGAALKTIGDAIKQAAGPGPSSPIGAVGQAAVDSGSLRMAQYASRIGVENSQDFASTGAKETIGGITPGFTYGPPAALAGNGKGPNGGNVDQTNHVQVTVQGGANPKETGDNVQRGVTDAMRQAAKDAFGALAATGG